MNLRMLFLLFFGVVAVAAGIVMLGSDGEPEVEKSGLVKITFVTDWRAQAEHGGFYQALAKGYYEEEGLDVTIRPGSPSINVPQLLASGSVEFGLGSNMFIPLNIAAQSANAVAVMASFQKDPQVMMAHPDAGIRTMEDMKGHPIFISDASIGALWPWMKAKFGFEDSQIRKYTGSLAPFLQNKEAIQEGYLTSEPYVIEKQANFRPEVFLLADHGYPGYAAFVLARYDLVQSDSDLVQKFVNATIRGWVSYLYGDAAPANALILQDNKEMTPEIIEQARDKMRRYGIVDSGDTETLGIGAMTDERWKSFFDTMVGLGVYPSDLVYTNAYALDYVDQGYGLDLKKRLLGQ